MLNNLLLIILSASCAALLFYYLSRLPWGNSRPASLLLLPKPDPLLAHVGETIQRHQLLVPKQNEIEPIPKEPITLPLSSPPSPTFRRADSMTLPPLTLLNLPRGTRQRAKYQAQSGEGAHKQARLITETLAAFDIPAQIVQIHQGPTITQFGLQPGFIESKNGKRRKIKVNAITALTNDLALALSAKSLRIYPVPGKPYLGLEIPNQKSQLVTLASLLSSEQFAEIYQKGGLPIALGRDITGQPVAADLTQMPHSLIAGATGSGKSVCLNAIIASLLFNYGPDELKLLMIDPKMVELIGYNGLPHLISPVITDMEKVMGALTWAVAEMEKRYKLLRRLFLN